MYRAIILCQVTTIILTFVYAAIGNEKNIKISSKFKCELNSDVTPRSYSNFVNEIRLEKENLCSKISQVNAPTWNSSCSSFPTSWKMQSFDEFFDENLDSSIAIDVLNKILALLYDGKSNEYITEHCHHRRLANVNCNSFKPWQRVRDLITMVS